jgi:uncharacterized phage-associated protein
MPAPYAPLAIANQFIIKARDFGCEHMKLQKLVYISYGWWLAFNPSKPLCNEKPQVWKHGPVFPSLYQILKSHGRSSIKHIQKAGPFSTSPVVDETDEKIHNLIDWVWDNYGVMDAFQLSDLTHQPNTPWEKVARNYGFRVPNDTPIPDEIIATHYKGLASERGINTN